MALVCTNCKQVVTEKMDPTTGMPIAVWVCEFCGEENHTETPAPAITNFAAAVITPSPEPIPEPVTPDLAAAQADITAAAAALTPDPIPPAPVTPKL